MKNYFSIIIVILLIIFIVLVFSPIEGLVRTIANLGMWISALILSVIGFVYSIRNKSALIGIVSIILFLLSINFLGLLVISLLGGLHNIGF